MILIHIPKTAGQSFAYSSKAQTFGHKPICKIETDANQDVFTITRNPYDRAVSVHYFMRQLHKNPPFDTGKMYKDVNFYWQRIYKNRHRLGKSIYHLPQFWFLCEGGCVSKRITSILKYETLEHDYNILSQTHNIGKLIKRNISRYRPATPWQDELTPESIAKIGELYAEDFEHLNYERIS